MVTYNPDVFEIGNLEDAKSIILTNEAQASTTERWITETPYLIGQLLQWCRIESAAPILDFGCGVGRMSKALIEVSNACVWGIDGSQAMRSHAVSYVDDARFAALSPLMLDTSIHSGQRWSLALSVWVLQHCPDLISEVDRLFAALKPGGVLFVVDMQHRAIPTVSDGWVDDGQSVERELRRRFACIHMIRFSAPQAPTNLLESAWIGLFQKPR